MVPRFEDAPSLTSSDGQQSAHAPAEAHQASTCHLITPVAASDPCRAAQIPGLANSLVQHVADSFDTTHPDAIRQDAEGLEQQRVWLFGREDGVPPPVSENALRRMLACVFLSSSDGLQELMRNRIRQVLRPAIIRSDEAASRRT